MDRVAASLATDKERMIKERMERIRAGVEAETRKRRAEERSSMTKRQRSSGSDGSGGGGGLYGDLPMPDPEKDRLQAEKRKEEADRKGRGLRLPPLPPTDMTKVIFLDIDGVMRPLTKGGFAQMCVDGEFTLKSDTSDFIGNAMLALRHIVEETGAFIVLHSEWRRDEVMRDGVDAILKQYGMPPIVTWTPTNLDRAMGTEDPFQAFVERRAREISVWVRKNPQVKQWVVLDDINMVTADEDENRRPETVKMAPRIVQSHNMHGLSMDNAKAAVRILRGEKLPVQILEEQPYVSLNM